MFSDAVAVVFEVGSVILSSKDVTCEVLHTSFLCFLGIFTHLSRMSFLLPSYLENLAFALRGGAGVVGIPLT